jgi:hypothetical protein
MSAESQQRQPLLGNGSADIPVARQWPQQTHATIEELLEALFSPRSVPRLYITRTSCHYRRVLIRPSRLCEVDVRWPPAFEDMNPEEEEHPPSSAVKTVTENISLCVIVIYKV